MTKPTKFEPICNLVGGSISGSSDGRNVLYNDGQTPPSQSDIDAKYNSMVSDWEAQEYARNRASEYPPIGDQLDMIYKDMKNGTTTHAEAVEAVKTKHPKG